MPCFKQGLYDADLNLSARKICEAEMNIFMTDKSAGRSAINLDDLRVNKMILETAQIMSTVVRKLGYEDDNLYKSTHPNHPSTLWAGDTHSNFWWLFQHGQALCRVYSLNSNRTHASQKVIYHAAKYTRFVPRGKQLPIRLAINFDEWPDVELCECPIQTYRNYMNAKWDSDVKEPVWRNRQPPEWRMK